MKSYNNKIIRNPLLAALALAGLTSGQVQAQVEQDADKVIDQIIVTASKRALTLQETPIAVAVVTKEAIEQTQVFDIADLQALVPTLKVGTATRTTNQTFNIRGFGSSSALGTEPSVGVFVDGVFRSRSTGALADLPRLERVEVLSGPQSTLFGKNASAGVISIITEAPSFEKNGDVQLSVGNYNHTGAKAYFSGGVSDTLAMSVSAGINKRDGYTEAVLDGIDDVDNRNRWNIRGQALWQPNPETSVRIIADYSKIDEICCAATNLINGPTSAAISALGGVLYDTTDPFHRTHVFKDIPRSKIEDQGLSIHIERDFDQFTLTSISAVRKNEFASGGNVGGTTIALASGISKGTEIDSISQEFRLTSTSEGPLSWIAGGFYFDEKISSENGLVYGDDIRPYVSGLTGGLLPAIEASLGVPPGVFFAGGTRVINQLKQDNKDYSLFGKVDYEFNDSWTGTLGLNYTNDKKQALVRQVENGDVFSSIGALAAGPLGGVQFRPPLVNLPNPVEDGKSDDSDTTYQLRLAYKVNDSLNMYLSHATGFKSTSWDLSEFTRPDRSLAAELTAAGVNSSNPKYGSRLSSPEYSTVNEFGVKYWSPKFALNLAVFTQQLEDFQVRSFDGVDFFQANAGETSVDGFEVDMRYSPVESWTFTLAATFLDPIYDDFSNAPPTPTSPRDADGNRLPADLSGTKPTNIAEERFVLGVLYNHSLSNGMDMFVRADYQYESDVKVSTANPEFSREVKNLGMSAGLNINQNLSMQVWGRNLTDDENILSVFGAAAQPGTISAFINQPRSYGASLNYRF